MEKQTQQLGEQKKDVVDELMMLRKEDKKLQKKLNKASQDGPTKDIAKLLKRYYEMEEQFGQMKKDIKQDMKNVLAKIEKKIVEQVQGHLVENEKKMNERLVDNEKNMQEKLVEKEKKMQKHVEKRLGETEDHFKQQVDGRLTENEKQIQQLLGVNEVKIWGHGQEIQQKVKESIAEHGTFMEQAAAVVLGETVNEQGYFTRMIVRTRHRCLYLR
jgi:hypothetical protein